VAAPIGIHTNFESRFSRGFAARCEEVALPFRKLLDFSWGYAPAGLAQKIIEVDPWRIVTQSRNLRA
jgi:hypothetical protein